MTTQNSIQSSVSGPWGQGTGRPSPCGRPLLYVSETLSLYHAVEPPSAGSAHAHADLQISLPLRGSYSASWEAASGGTLRQELSPGTLLLCASQQPHEIEVGRDTELAALWLPPALLARAAGDLGTAPAPQRTGAVQDPLLHPLCVSLLAELSHNPSPSRLYVDSAAYLLAAHLLCRRPMQAVPPDDAGTGLSPRRLRRVLAYMEENLDQDIALSDLAAEAGLSVSHFGPLFRQSVGAAPYRYVLSRRIERAKTLLRRGGLSVGEVAAEVGFCDQSQFTRQFKQQVGVTPRAFAKSVS